MGTLYIVPTPIGNLEDITLRALRLLQEVRLIAAEDTRHSLKLLTHYDIHTPLTSYYEFNKHKKLPVLLDALDLGDVALISDAGTPGVNDPGYELIGGAIAAGIKVVVLPGANAIVTALSACDLDQPGFCFLGFPPRKSSQLAQLLEQNQEQTQPLVFYESPNRLIKTLTTARQVFGDRQAVVALELTKMFEEFQRASLSELIAFYEENPPKGEVTLLIAGA